MPYQPAMVSKGLIILYNTVNSKTYEERLPIMQVMLQDSMSGKPVGS